MAGEQNGSPAIWVADSTHPQEAAKLREGLRSVQDPELGLNIIELGLVREVTMSGSEVDIKMILTTPFCPYGPAMLDMTRVKAEEIMAVPVKIEVGMEMWEPGMMEEGTGGDWGLF
jgi:metal-sulfur cluster biosynthetic enzyme